jgi:hypothetical protein
MFVETPQAIVFRFLKQFRAQYEYVSTNWKINHVIESFCCVQKIVVFIG